MGKKPIICVYGFDMTSEGKLGKGSIARLHAALCYYSRHGGEIALAATVSPNHLEAGPMRQLMSDWLKGRGVPENDIIVMEAQTFDTDGEAKVFAALSVHSKCLASSWWHLPRIWRLHRKYGESAKMHLVPSGDMPSPKNVALELAKHSVMFMPVPAQKRLRDFARRVLGKTS